MQDDGEGDDDREPQDINSIDAEDAQAAVASATATPEGACANRSDEDSLWSLESPRSHQLNSEQATDPIL